MASLLWIQTKLRSQEECPPASMLLPGSRLRGTAESHNPVLVSELGNQMKKCPAPSMNSPWLPLTFTLCRDVPKLLTDKMKAELLHLFMQLNCLEQHLALWGYSNVVFVDSKSGRRERSLSTHLICPCFTVEKIEDACPNMPSVRTRTWVHSICLTTVGDAGSTRGQES